MRGVALTGSRTRNWTRPFTASPWLSPRHSCQLRDPTSTDIGSLSAEPGGQQPRTRCAVCLSEDLCRLEKSQPVRRRLAVAGSPGAKQIQDLLARLECSLPASRPTSKRFCRIPAMRTRACTRDTAAHPRAPLGREGQAEHPQAGEVLQRTDAEDARMTGPRC